MIPVLAAALLVAALSRRGDPAAPVAPPPPAIVMRSGTDLAIAKLKAAPGGLLGSKPMTVVDVRQKGTTAGKPSLAAYNGAAEGVRGFVDSTLPLGREAFKAVKLEWLFDWVNNNAKWAFAPVFFADWVELMAGGRIHPENVLVKNAPPEVLDRLRAEGRLA